MSCGEWGIEAEVAACCVLYSLYAKEERHQPLRQRPAGRVRGDPAAAESDGDGGGGHAPPLPPPPPPRLAAPCRHPDDESARVVAAPVRARRFSRRRQSPGRADCPV